jgi:uncharacterized protein (TIGR02186 family)
MSRSTRSAAVLAALVALAPLQAWAQPLIADLSDHHIAITTGFAGTEVLIYGATEGEGDVAVIIRGPESPVMVRRKERRFGIWVNRRQVQFNNVPSFYRIAVNRPLDEIASAATRARFQMGLAHLRMPPVGTRPPVENAAFRAGLIRNRERSEQFAGESGRVSFLGPRLFRTRIYLPANVPPGQFTVEVLLLQGGQVVHAQTTPMLVGRSGLSAEVFDFAHRQPAFYGIIAVVIAVAAGWSASVAFRKS